MTDINEKLQIEGISIKDIGNLSIVELLVLQKLLRHGKPVVRHILYNEISQFLIREQKIVADSINLNDLPDSAQKFHRFLKSKKKFSSSSFYYSLDNLESKGLVKFNYDDKNRVETVEATRYTEILNNTVLKHIIKNGLLVPEQDNFLTIILKEAIRLIDPKKYGTLLFIWFRDFIDAEHVKEFSTVTDNLFILSKKITFDNAVKYGLDNVQYSALFNNTIRESDNFFDAVIVPHHFEDVKIGGITKKNILKEAFRVVNSSGVVIIHGFIPIPNINHGILNIFVKWVKEIYRGVNFYTEEEFKKELVDAGAKTAEAFVYKGHLFGIGRK